MCPAPSLGRCADEVSKGVGIRLDRFIGREISVCVRRQTEISHKKVNSVLSDYTERLRVGNPSANGVHFVPDERTLVKSHADYRQIGKVNSVLRCDGINNESCRRLHANAKARKVCGRAKRLCWLRGEGVRPCPVPASEYLDGNAARAGMEELGGFRELAQRRRAGDHRRDRLGIRAAGAEFNLEPCFLEIPVFDRDDVADLTIRN